ncbi:MAG: hypothetical protein ACRBDI_08455 [Alphaproteobacteria bacterium]
MGKIYSFQPGGMDKVIDDNHNITACAADKSSYILGGGIEQQMDIEQATSSPAYSPAPSNGYEM